MPQLKPDKPSPYALPGPHRAAFRFVADYLFRGDKLTRAIKPEHCHACTGDPAADTLGPDAADAWIRLRPRLLPAVRVAPGVTQSDLEIAVETFMPGTGADGSLDLWDRGVFARLCPEMWGDEWVALQDRLEDLCCVNLECDQPAAAAGGIARGSVRLEMLLGDG